MGEEAVFDFQRMDILTPTDDQVFDPACDRNISVG
jgi:hypothetical protein